MANIPGTPGNDTLDGTDSADIINGLAGNDVIRAKGGDDELRGGDGDDQMYGETGNDYLNGGSGADQMYGGTGNDNYIVDNVGDVVIENASEGLDTVATTVSFTLGANVENLTLTNSADINGTGNDLSNYMLGNAGNNFLKGEGGDDQINGRAGNDNIFGGAGNDTLLGDVGNDLLDGGNGNDVLYGNNDNDRLFGSGGDDILYGGNGNDVLAGGGDIFPAGNNTLWGGAGADGFRFYFAPTGIDTIKDFQRSEVDKVEIHPSFGATSLDQFSYDSNTGALSFNNTQFATVEFGNKPADFSVQKDIVLLP